MMALMREIIRRKRRRHAQRAEPPIVATETPAMAQVPDHLAIAIDNAVTLERGEPDPETGAVRTLVEVAALGAWHWGGTQDAADRIQRHHPEVTAAGAKRAAQLLAKVIVSRRRERARAKTEAERKSWTWDW